MKYLVGARIHVNALAKRLNVIRIIPMWAILLINLFDVSASKTFLILEDVSKINLFFIISHENDAQHTSTYYYYHIVNSSKS